TRGQRFSRNQRNFAAQGVRRPKIITRHHGRTEPTGVFDLLARIGIQGDISIASDVRSSGCSTSTHVGWCVVFSSGSLLRSATCEAKQGDEPCCDSQARHVLLCHRSTTLLESSKPVTTAGRDVSQSMKVTRPSG